MRDASKFGPETTTAEVLADIDLHGKVALVTGGSSGLGQETARALADKGAHVILTARDVPKGEAVAAAIRASTGNQGVEVEKLELDSLAGIRSFAERFLARHEELHILVNNAGVMACPFAKTADGFEMQFGTNHLGHFLMTGLLLPVLRRSAPSRIVSVSSRGHHLSPVVFEDINFEHRPYHNWQSYGQAKTANSLFAVQLDALGQDAGVRAFAAHPGGIMTPLQRHLTRDEMMAAGWVDEDGNADDRFKTPEQGASTSTWAATSPQLEGMGGVYCENCDIADPTEVGSPTARIEGVDAHAIDPDVAARLWTVSAQLTGVDAFAAA